MNTQQLLIAIPIVIWVLLLVTRQVFKKDFKQFSLRLAPAHMQAVSWQEAVSILWCYSWRTGVFIIISETLFGLFFAFGFDMGPQPFTVLSIVLESAVQVFVLRTVLRKQFKSFVIEMVAR